jgi:hypothetical protein
VNGLVEFLRARLIEDETTALAADGDSIEAIPLYEGVGYLTLRGDHADRYTGELPATLADHVARHDPARILSEVRAKRRILAEVVPEIDGMEDRIDGEWGAGDPAERESMALLRLLALPYADHPDYRAEWRAGEDPS